MSGSSAGRLRPLTSRDNPAVKRLRALSQDAAARRTFGQTVLDGPHLLKAYLDAGKTPESLWFARGAQENPELQALAARVTGRPAYVLDDAVFRRSAPTDQPSGVLAVIPLPAAPSIDASGTVVVLDGIQDAGNVGSILRTAAAAGVNQVWLGKGSARAWSPRVLRAGMGAHFSLSIIEDIEASVMSSLPLCALSASHAGAETRRVTLTALEAPCTVFQSDLRGDRIWVFGSEGQGVSEAWRAKASLSVSIPMPGKVESLNVAAAAAICLFEAVRQNSL
jgi:TrmH family RNA methyltransferase